MRPALFCALLLALTGCVVQGPPPVPVARYETVPPPPAPRFVWQPGGWHWDGRAYVWHAGHYVERRPEYHHWVVGHWGGGVWIAAHWE